MRLISGDDQNAVNLVTTMPALGSPPSNWLERVANGFNGGTSPGAWTALAFVPLADFRVVARSSGSSAWSNVDVVQTVGVTSGTMAVIVTSIIVCLVWTTLFLFGKARGVPGSGNPILQVISTRRGYASLSQLQVILWTFVVGGTAIYVMVLSGNLITITDGTLVLLGISGVATLGSKLQSATSTQGGLAQAPQAVQVNPRGPLWSDLVMDDDNEIDVTRVQMLFFTVVVAFFVIVRVLASGEIPDVPQGFLILMGISNSLYLGNKYVKQSST